MTLFPDKLTLLINLSVFDPPELLGNHCVCVCVCVHKCACVCTCVVSRLPPPELNSTELWNRCGFCN